MYGVILGLITFLVCSVQDYRTKQVSILLMMPFFFALTLSYGLSVFLGSAFLVSVIFYLRNFLGLNTGLGTADFILAIPTILLFEQFHFMSVISALFFIPVMLLVVGSEDRIPAIPGMAAGYIFLIILFLI